MTSKSIAPMNRLRYAKNMRLRGSCSMYATEYTWMSVPTTVMSSTNVSDSGSRSSPASRWNSPPENHVKRCTDSARSAARAADHLEEGDDADDGGRAGDADARPVAPSVGAATGEHENEEAEQAAGR